MDLRRVLKILHEVSSSGIVGALAIHLVLLSVATTTTALDYAMLRRAIEVITKWVLLPSLGVVLVTGLLAMAVHRPFHGARWAWLKAVFGVSMLEGTLGAVNATATEASALAARVAAGEVDRSAMNDVLRHEWAGLWVILAISIANIIVGVWRPRLQKTARPTSPGPTLAEPPSASAQSR